MVSNENIEIKIKSKDDMNVCKYMVVSCVCLSLIWALRPDVDYVTLIISIIWSQN